MGPTGPTSSWRPFGPLSALRAGFWPLGPANTVTVLTNTRLTHYPRVG